MPSKRKLLSPDTDFEFEVQEKEPSFNCVNGYVLENTTICICYPGWTSNYYSFDQCTVDSGENSTNSNSNKKQGIIYSDSETKEKNTSVAFIIFIIFLILLALGIVCAIFLCLFKKYKDIKLVKEKIKFEKKKNKQITQVKGEKGKDINSDKNNDEIGKDSVCLGVISNNDANSINNTENKE